MRTGLMLLVLLASCSISRADEPALAIESESVATLSELVERLEARVTELESELAQLKHAQQRTVLGGSLLAGVERSADEADAAIKIISFSPANGSIRIGGMYHDESGVIRDAGGRRVGYWGIDDQVYRFGGIPFTR